jgi:hypothetical protein
MLAFAVITYSGDQCAQLRTIEYAFGWHPSAHLTAIVGLIILGLNLIFDVEVSESARRGGYAVSLLVLLMQMSEWIIIHFGFTDACGPRS